MILFAFDCDSTLSSSFGPIPVDLLRGLRDAGYEVYIVSPSPFCALIRDISHFSPILGSRADVLKELKRRVQADRYIYVGDTQNDYRSAIEANFEFIPAHEFKKWVGENLIE